MNNIVQYICMHNYYMRTQWDLFMRYFIRTDNMSPPYISFSTIRFDTQNKQHITKHFHN